jgi:uncharacterized protein (TIGR02996 family)
MPKSPFPDPACRLPDEYGLLAAVLASPQDDLPKLVYADFLEEHADPRGPFLREWVAAKQAGKSRPKPPQGVSECWLSVIGYGLDAQLAALGEPTWADAIRQTAEPGILVRTRPHKGKALPTGASKMGGLPDLHPDTEWPEGENGPAAFIAQWNLEELAMSPVCRVLPRTGLLSSFIDLVPFVEGRGNGTTKVTYTPSLDELVEREPDEERSEENVLRECRVEFREWLMAPHASLPSLQSFLSSHDLYGSYYGFYYGQELHPESHRLLGHPQDVLAHPSPGGEPGWVLLTQFSQDKHLGLEMRFDASWFVMIHEDDLKGARFEDVSTECQGG